MTTPKPDTGKPDPEQRDPFDALLAGVREFTNAADENAGREILLAAVKQWLAELTDDDFAAVVAEVREPADDGPAYPENWGYQPTK